MNGRRRLADHKAVVKNWSTRRVQLVQSSRPVTHCDGRVAETEPEARVMQWLRDEPSNEKVSDPRGIDGDACAYEESVATADDGVVDSEEEAEEMLPSTVGQVKHAYRARARREEAHSDRRAQLAAQRQREKLKIYGLYKRRDTTMKRDEDPLQAEPLEPTEEPADQTTTDERCFAAAEEGGAGLLDAASLVSDAEYRAEVLRIVRRELSSGRDVRLRASFVRDPPPPITDVRLAVQQLCSESLLFCTRDQNMLPTVDELRRVVSLKLVTRYPSA